MAKRNKNEEVSKSVELPSGPSKKPVVEDNPLSKKVEDIKEELSDTHTENEKVMVDSEIINSLFEY